MVTLEVRWMIPWLALKLTPAAALLLELEADLRYTIYVVLALMVLVRCAFVLQSGRLVKLDTFGFASLGILFVASAVPNIGETLALPYWAELLPLCRGLFLAASLPVLVAGSKRPQLWLYTYFLSLLSFQVYGLIASTQIVEGATLNRFDIDEQRITGVYTNSWSYSYSALVFTVCSLLMWRRSDRGVLQNTYLLLSLLGFVGVFFSICRGALVAMPLVMFFWAFESLLKRRGTELRVHGTRIILIGISVGVLLLGGSFAVGYLFPHEVGYYLGLWDRRLQPGLEGESVRWASNVAGVQMFLEYPMFGVGWDRSYYLGPDFGGVQMTCHNGLIQAAAEGGLLGLAFSVGLLCLLPFRLFMRWREVPGSLIFLGGWLGVLAYNMLASNYMLESHWDMLCFWILYTASTKSSSVPKPSAVPAATLFAVRPGAA